MQNEKQNLISLSLAGSVGFYLYSKLAAVGMASSFSGGREPVSERTKRELLITIEPEVVEPIVEDVVEDIFEEGSPPVEETTVDDILAAAEEDVEDVVILEETEAIPIAEEVEETEVPTLEVEEPVIETPVVEEEVIEEEPGLDIEIPNIEPDDSDVDVSLFDTEEEMPIDNLFGAISENDAEVDAIPSIVEEPIAQPIVEPVATPVVEEPVAETPALFDEEDDVITPPALDFETPDLIENAEEISVSNINDLDDLSAAPPVVETPVITPPVVEDPVATLPVEEVVNPVEELPVQPSLFEEPVAETPVIEDIASVSQPAAPAATEPAPQVMDNIETLHPVDKKDEGAKAEYKSIMDFFSSL